MFKKTWTAFAWSDKRQNKMFTYLQEVTVSGLSLLSMCLLHEKWAGIESRAWTEETRPVFSWSSLATSSWWQWWRWDQSPILKWFACIVDQSAGHGTRWFTQPFKDLSQLTNLLLSRGQFFFFTVGLELLHLCVSWMTGADLLRAETGSFPLGSAVWSPPTYLFLNILSFLWALVNFTSNSYTNWAVVWVVWVRGIWFLPMSLALIVL